LEVRRYKREWEQLNHRLNIPRSQSHQRIPKLERQLFQFEIKRTIYDALSAKDSDQEVIKRAFEFLECISVLEGLNRPIIAQLQSAFALSALSELNKPVALCRALPRYFSHLAGPIYANMSRQDEKDITKALETIEFVHNLCIEQNKRSLLLRALKSSLGEFIEIAMTYKNDRIFRKALSILKDVQRSCAKVFYKRDRRFPTLSREITAYLADVRDELNRAKLKWRT
jgi:hypothetical protein